MNEDDIESAVQAILPEGWGVYDGDLGMDFMLECPHGNIIEQDGRCPSGCVSPLPW